MILRIRPELVGDYLNAPDVSFGFGFEPAYRGWTTKDRTARGHIGSPCNATADKGEHLFAEFSGGVIRFLDEVLAWDGGAWNDRRSTQP